MPGQTFLGNDWNGITGGSATHCELRVVNVTLNRVVYFGGSTVTANYANGIGVQAPDSEGTTDRCDSRIGADEHTESR